MPEQITFNRFTASYQLFGDVPDGKKWLEEILEEVKKDWPAVLRFEVLACELGSHGIRYLVFQVDITRDLPTEGDLRTYDSMRDFGRGILNGWLSDTDVEILWVSAMDSCDAPKGEM